MSFLWWPKSASDPPAPPRQLSSTLLEVDRCRDRRERIATAVLAGLAANNARVNLSIDDDVDAAIQSADKLIEQLDKEATR